MGDNSNTGSMEVDNVAVAATKGPSWQDLRPKTIPLKRNLPSGSLEPDKAAKKKIIVQKREKSPSPTPSSSSISSPEEGEITNPYIFPKKTAKKNVSLLCL